MKKHLYEPPVTKEVALFSAQQPICASDVRMEHSAADLDFSQAAKYRDEMWALQEYLKVWKD